MTRLLPVLLLCPVVAHAALDVERQDIHADISGSELVIDLQLTVRGDGESVDLALLKPSLPVTLLEVDGEVTSLQDDPDFDVVSHVVWDTAPAADATTLVRLVMRGQPSCARNDGSGFVNCVFGPDETILAPPSVRFAWAYLGAFEVDLFTGTTVVVAPRELEVAAGQGAPTSVVDTGVGPRIWSFTVDIPTEVPVIYARGVQVVRSGEAPVVAGYYVPGGAREQLMTHAVGLGAQVMDIYGATYGTIPLDEFRLMTVPENFPFGGLGVLGNVLLGDYVIGDLDYLLEQGVSHELAHAWFGGVASCTSYEKGFMQEATAEYSAWRALGELQGNAVRVAGVRMNTVWYMFRRPNNADIAVLDSQVEQSPLYVHVTYHKGSSVLRTLEEMAGKEALTQALRALITRGELTAGQLVAEINNATGRSILEEFSQWLLRTGHPTLTVSSNTRVAGSGYTVAVSVDSEGDFSYRLPLVVDLEDGTSVVDVADVEEGSNAFNISTGSRPVAVRVDPEWTLVRRVYPDVLGDVTLDGRVDAEDLMEVALFAGGYVPDERRVDGSYDPLVDLNEDERIDDDDLLEVLAAAER
ncbi:MAG: M1 family aminopeptidase [Myxococcota bacterium]